MIGQSSKLSQVSLVSANFGNGLAYREILLDWFKFLGGKPGEVVVVDGGSDRDTQKVYLELYQEGLIDKLQLIPPHHPDNNKERCFIQEYIAGVIASNPYILWFKIDTLPYREGHDDWLEQAIADLDREDVFAVGGAFNRTYPHFEASPGWYFTEACTINFSLMKRSTFIAVMQEFAGEYIASGFQGEHEFGRFLLEMAFSAYMDRHKVYALCKIEDPTWTVFHTNALGKNLLEVRQKFLAREDIKTFMNPCLSNDINQFLYYGKPPIQSGMVKKMKMAFGNTKAGSYWRQFKNSWLAEQ